MREPTPPIPAISISVPAQGLGQLVRPARPLTRRRRCRLAGHLYKGASRGHRHRRPPPQARKAQQPERGVCRDLQGISRLPDLPTSPNTPTVREALRSHRYRMARAGITVKQAEALTAENMAAIRTTALRPRRGRGGMETGEQARRRGLLDIALVELMRDCLLRRSEAADVRWSHITSHADGTGRLLVGVSKTDQEGEGALLFVSSQTMRDLCRHQARWSAEEQPVFGLHPRSIGRRIAAAARAAGRGWCLQRAQRPRRNGEGPRAGRGGAARAHDGGTLEGTGDGRALHLPRARRARRRRQIPQGGRSLRSGSESFLYSVIR